MTNSKFTGLRQASTRQGIQNSGAKGIPRRQGYAGQAARPTTDGVRPHQTELFEPTIAQQFEAWKATPGGAQVMRIAYAVAARYGRRYIERGRRVSVRLIWEMLRDNITFIRARMKAKGIMLEKLDGFALNDHFHAHVARHIMGHRPEWQGMFELRELGAARNKRKVTIIKIDQPV